MHYRLHHVGAFIACFEALKLLEKEQGHTIPSPDDNGVEAEENWWPLPTDDIK
jgi:hypothetical protein